MDRGSRTGAGDGELSAIEHHELRARTLILRIKFIDVKHDLVNSITNT